MPAPLPYPVVNTLTELQVLQLHALYQGEWWSVGRSLKDIETMLENCLVFGVVDPASGDLIAFARVITDRVFKAFLFDVIVHPGHRGKGIGNFLLQQIVEHPTLIGVRHIELYCQAERVEFYSRHGFSAVLDNLLLMRRTRET